MTAQATPVEANPLSEEQLRAGTYALLAGLLRYPLPADILSRLLTIEAADDNSDDAIANAWSGLKKAAENTEFAKVDDEYHDLFLGVGRGELVPHGSWYLTGFMMEKPLGELRDDLAAFGYARQDDVSEPEDHVAALCEVMSMVIMDDEIPLGLQRRFFDNHVGSWMETFFTDLTTASSADFYRAVGQLGSAFIKLEKRYLSMMV